jgi:hypothetical protein
MVEILLDVAVDTQFACNRKREAEVLGGGTGYENGGPPRGRRNLSESIRHSAVSNGGFLAEIRGLAGSSTSMSI